MVFRRNCRFHQYMPKKVTKYEMKFWLYVDANSYYVLNAVPCIGGQPDQERQNKMSAHVVLQLVKLMSNSNGNPTMNNFFTSIPLPRELQTKKITSIGTLRKNKSEIPTKLLSNAIRPVGSSMFAFNDSLTLVSYDSRKNKAALLLSSKHHDNEVDSKDGKPIIVLK